MQKNGFNCDQDEGRNKSRVWFGCVRMGCLLHIQLRHMILEEAFGSGVLTMARRGERAGGWKVGWPSMNGLEIDLAEYPVGPEGRQERVEMLF